MAELTKPILPRLKRSPQYTYDDLIRELDEAKQTLVDTFKKLDELYMGLGEAFPGYTKVESDERFAPMAHAHDSRYFTKEEIDDAFDALISSLPALYAPVVHDHDGRYYTESEVDTFITNLQSNINNRMPIAGGNFTGAVTIQGKTIPMLDLVQTWTREQTVQAPHSSVQLKLERTGSNLGAAWLGTDDSDLLAVRPADLSYPRLQLTRGGALKLPDNPAFSASHAPNAGAVTATMIFPNVNVNRGNNYNPSNGRFTAPVAGAYFFNAHTLIETGGSTTKYGYLQFYKNGALYGPTAHSSYNATRAYETVSISYVIPLAAGDYVVVVFTSGTGGTVYGGQYSGFSGFLLG